MAILLVLLGLFGGIDAHINSDNNPHHSTSREEHESMIVDWMADADHDHGNRHPQSPAEVGRDSGGLTIPQTI